MDTNESPKRRPQRGDFMTPEQKAAQATRLHRGRADLAAGSTNPLIVCPHCQHTGSVRTKKTKQKAGVSGGKAQTSSGRPLRVVETYAAVSW